MGLNIEVNQYELNFLQFSNYQDSDAKNKKNSTKICASNCKFSIVFLLGEIDPAVIERWEFGKRGFSKLLALFSH